MGVDRALVLFRKISHNLLQRRRVTLATGYTLAQDLVHEIFLTKSQSTDGWRTTHVRVLCGPGHGGSSELLTQTRDETSRAIGAW